MKQGKNVWRKIKTNKNITLKWRENFYSLIINLKIFCHFKFLITAINLDGGKKIWKKKI